MCIFVAERSFNYWCEIIFSFYIAVVELKIILLNNFNISNFSYLFMSFFIINSVFSSVLYCDVQ